MNKKIIDLYTATELIKQDGVYYKKIENSKEYIPVKIQDSKNKYAFKTWKIKKDYSIKYIRRTDLLEYLKDIEKTVKNKKE